MPYLKFSKVFEGYPFYSYHSSTFPVFPQERRAKPLLMVQASYLSFVIGETVLAPRSSYTWGRGGPATLYAQGRTQTSGLSPIKVRPARVIIASHKFITCIDILMASHSFLLVPSPLSPVMFHREVTGNALPPYSSVAWDATPKWGEAVIYSLNHSISWFTSPCASPLFLSSSSDKPTKKEKNLHPISFGSLLLFFFLFSDLSFRRAVVTMDTHCPTKT